MRIRHLILPLIPAILLSLTAPVAFAAPQFHVITLKQLDAVHDGEREAEVSRILGAPEDITRWFGGERSMVYEISSHNDMLELVYIDLDKNARVSAIHVLSRE